MKINELAKHNFGDFDISIVEKSGYIPHEKKDSDKTDFIPYTHSYLVVHNKKWNEPIHFKANFRNGLSFSDSREKQIRVKKDLWGRESEMPFEAGKHKYVSVIEMTKYLDSIVKVPGVAKALVGVFQ